MPEIKVGCPIFDESEKNQLVEKSLHSPSHRPLWTGIRVPTPKGGGVARNECGHPSHLDPGLQ